MSSIYANGKRVEIFPFLAWHKSQGKKKKMGIKNENTAILALHFVFKNAIFLESRKATVFWGFSMAYNTAIKKMLHNELEAEQ